MNVCIPVDADQGTDSPVCAHFGSAPFFMIVDTDTGACRALPNRNLHHAHGMCQPLLSLQGERLDAIVVGGIGLGALNKLMATGLEVYRADRSTVGATVDALKGGLLKPMTPASACGHHGAHHAHPHGQSQTD
jgi:predicted Fe-Mo cluster-binding NifX family protein